MTYLNQKLKCEDCFKPVARRLGLFQAKDEYECYSDSYVKCFWGLCDYHKSIDNFTAEPKEKVITTQPLRQGLLITSTVVKQKLVKN